jgi:hypothetical protein
MVFLGSPLRGTATKVWRTNDVVSYDFELWRTLAEQSERSKRLRRFRGGCVGCGGYTHPRNQEKNQCEDTK